MIITGGVMAGKHFSMTAAALVADGSAAAVAELARRGRSPDGRKGGAARPARVASSKEGKMTVTKSDATDQGGRNYQEDSVFTGRVGEFHLLCVADGMGGHKGGKAASEAVLKQFLASLPTKLDALSSWETPKHAIVASFEEAHQAGITASPGGTTLSIALIDPTTSTAWVAWVGDSPIIVCRPRLNKQFGMLFRARPHGVGNMLLRCMGAAAGQDPGSHQVDIEEMALQPGDLVIVASDGLDEVLIQEDRSSPDWLPETMVWFDTLVLDTKPQLEATCRELIARAISHGSTDNCTVALARVS